MAGILGHEDELVADAEGLVGGQGWDVGRGTPHTVEGSGDEANCLSPEREKKKFDFSLEVEWFGEF